jgi:hypothetical protein
VNERVLRVALAVGAFIDGAIAVVALFFQPWVGPLSDIPAKDPAFTAFAGGEFLIVALVYLLILRDLKRYWPLLWLVALDQLLAVVLPAEQIASGNVVASWKTIAPMPLSALLAVIYVWGAVTESQTAAPRS